MIMFAPFVNQNEKEGWESYAVQHQDWISQDYVSLTLAPIVTCVPHLAKSHPLALSRTIQGYRGWNDSDITNIPEEIYDCDFCANDTRRGYVDTGFMLDIMRDQGYDENNFTVPIAQFGPAPINSSLSMFNLFSDQIFKKEFVASLEYNVPVVSESWDLEFFLKHIDRTTSAKKFQSNSLRSFTLDPIKEDFFPDSRTIGYLIGVVPWEAFFAGILPDGVNGITVVVVSDCDSEFTYVVNGDKDKDDEGYIGDMHDTKWSKYMMKSQFFWKEHPKGSSRHCHFDFHTYPSDAFYERYRNNDPSVYAAVLFSVFLFTAIIFYLYDRYIQMKQSKVLSKAQRAEAIVTSVFPKEVGLRLIQQAEEEETGTYKNSSKNMLTFLTSTEDDNRVQERSKPIADLFPNTTVMFADITGFTAWSSMREPSQVFILLESIYKAFDIIAKRRRVFKVETVGDCYVAVSGLPEPRKDHPVVMSLFAADCLVKMAVQVQALEVELGPDTAELGVRIGLHSGPVTAGVLRGERARFQLFGDTVNTAARIESTGQKNKIQISKDTADLLAARGKGHWFIPREDKVTAKGKGELQTFWLKNIRGGEGRSVVSTFSLRSSNNSASGHTNTPTTSRRRFSLQATIERKLQKSNTKKMDRLVDWNVDVLMTLLKQVEERREQCGIKPDPWSKVRKLEDELSIPVSESGRTSLDEVVEIIELPRFDAGFDAHVDGRRSSMGEKQSNELELQESLREYVRAIASLYNDNSFHNFEHASHVTMSVMKLLSRIVAPNIASDDARELHDHTYGITSDPLTQFAVVFSAMLHDVDHLGVPNTQLVKEGISLAGLYKNKSVAEQNSIDLAWALLMEERFEPFRKAIYSTTSELKRFRQLVVNTILATDIMDKELKTLRNARWDKAFSESASVREESTMDTTNRKATIVIEHLIQASDIAHTMQHWQVYRKWNARLFLEMYRAYREGRAEKDPSDFWYEGEIGFFDFYIIPLAKKLESCGVFGVSSHEYLNYAEQNRKEWEMKGRGVVEELIQQAHAQSYKPAKAMMTDQAGNFTLL